MRRTFEGPDHSDSSTAHSTRHNLLPAPSTDGVSGNSSRPQFTSRTSSKTKDSVKGKAKGKGKGKAPQWASEDDDDDDEEAYVTSNDYGTPAPHKSANSSVKGKGVMRNGFVQTRFHDAAEGDEEDLYG